MLARGDVTCVNKNEALYKRSRVNVKVMRGSTFTLTRSLSNIASILFARKLSTRTHVKIRRRWKSILVNVPVEVGLHVCGTRNRRYVSRFQASGGKREAGGERETRDTRDGERRAKNYHPSGASCALRLFRAGLRSPQKREKKTTPILQAARTEEQIKVVYLLCKEIA